jgi:hypothetical protein
MGMRKNKSLLDQATDTVSEYVDQVKPQLETALTSAKEKAGPALADAKAKAGPALADAKAKASPMIATGVALAAQKAALAAEKAAEVADATATKAEAAAAPKKKHRLRKLVLITGIAAGAAFVASKLRGGSESQNWQSSYTPTPAPPAPRRPVTPHDEGGATPAEAIADQAESAHPVTTPDDPADVVDIDKK